MRVYTVYTIIPTWVKTEFKDRGKKGEGGRCVPMGSFLNPRVSSEKSKSFRKNFTKKNVFVENFCFFCISFSREKGESFRDINNAKTLRK